MMTTSQEATFPIELQDQVIGNLCQDVKSLAACSLVSSHWSDSARKLLFPNFVAFIDVRSNEIARTSKLVQLLEAPHSRLGLYIQHVQIWGPDNPLGIEYTQTIHTEAYEYLSEVLQTILPRLPRVRDLLLSSLSWYRIPRETRAQLSSLSKVISLEWHRIFCGHLNDLVHFSNQSFPRLENLRMQDLRVKDNTQIERSNFAQLSSWFAGLRTLALFVDESTVPFLDGLLSGIIPVENLHSLDLEVLDSANLALVGSLIRVTAPTISVIRLNIGPVRQDFDEHPFPISLSQNINLKVLYFEPWLISRDIWWLEKIITSASSARGLEEIHLRFAASGTPNSFGFDFSSLEGLLLAQSAPSTKIVMECWEDERRQGPSLSEILISSMSELSKRGQLSVVLFDRYEASKKDFGFLGS
ncbi:hypothetical protein H2248_008115 [Termitomyces sp. 'cryptogamus']|nr:hypothetical protein H2248_008115 [Termitomyces sp. 'cryptogamus']